MINIHPSLLPAYPGLDTHARAIADGATTHGASVHFVTAALDAGPLIAQVRVPVYPGDDAPALAARVLAREHPLLVRVVGLFADRRLHLRDDAVWLDEQPLPQPLQLRDDDSLTLPGTPIDA
jgi:phosphoribosylglycinamide formyltransferase-1